jgi:hypothetical protein
VIDGSLQLDQSRDTPEERQLRNRWLDTAKAWEQLRKELGGIRPGERTSTQDFWRLTNQRQPPEKKKVERRRRSTVRRSAPAKPILATLPLTPSASGASVELSEKNFELFKKNLSRGRA